MLLNLLLLEKKLRIKLKLPEKNRLEAFSDGVFAIIITLLVLEIGVPHVQNADTKTIFEALYGILPKLTAFIISFVIIAVYWVSHHSIFSELKFVSGKILWYNLWILLLVCLLPFTTALIGDYPFVSGAVFIYSIHIFIIGVTYNGLEKIILSSRELLQNHNCPRYNIKRNLTGITLNLLACVFVFIWIPASYFFLIVSRLIFIVSQFNRKKS